MPRYLLVSDSETEKEWILFSSTDTKDNEDDYKTAEALLVANTESSKEWILDFGCSYHMCPTKSKFETFREVDGKTMLLGNNKTCKVMGVGIIRIKMLDGIERLLQDVRYVPELKRKLISLGVLDHGGYSYKCDNGSLR